MPPVVKTYLNLFLTSFMVFIIVFSTSGMTRTSSNLTPSSLSHLDIVTTLTSCVLPDKISLPIIMISFFHILIIFILNEI